MVYGVVYKDIALSDTYTPMVFAWPLISVLLFLLIAAVRKRDRTHRAVHFSVSVFSALLAFSMVESGHFRDVIRPTFVEINGEVKAFDRLDDVKKELGNEEFERRRKRGDFKDLSIIVEEGVFLNPAWSSLFFLWLLSIVFLIASLIYGATNRFRYRGESSAPYRSEGDAFGGVLNDTAKSFLVGVASGLSSSALIATVGYIYQSLSK